MGLSPPPPSDLRWKILQNGPCRKVAFRIIFNRAEVVRALSDAPSDNVDKTTDGRNDHGLDNADPRRNLHRPRDQRLPPCRVL